MTIELIAINKLKLLKRNPRTISKTAMEKCKASLHANPDFLDQRPILVNLDVNGIYNVYAGNQRVRAAKALGWKQIMCSVSIELSDDEIKKRIILDNAHYGENDFEILANDYDIELLLDCGFTEKDLHIDLPSAVQPNDDEDEKEDKIKLCPHCNGQL